VNVGAKRVLIDPVGVYVGSRDTWVPVKEGEIVAGGNECRDDCVGSRLPAPTPPVAVDGYVPSNICEELRTDAQ
jgi:hypothetical protein